MTLTENTEVLREKPVPVALRLSRIPHGLPEIEPGPSVANCLSHGATLRAVVSEDL
jgi:hypothetical protein